ncbi:MAG: RNA recognition motif domain-containing protein, partial [Chthoniobacterales bacterium]
MSTNYSTENPQRSSRGGRRRSRRGGSNRSNEGGSRQSSGNSNSSQRNRGGYSSRVPKKLTFWQKVVAFFTGGEKSSPAPARQTESRSDRFESKTAEPRTESRAERSPRPPRSGMRKPESVEVTTPRLYVGNLSFDAVESDLFELFSGVGIVQNVEVVSNRQTQRSKGFAFVQMQSIEEAKRAVAELHDKEYMGRKLVVSGAKASDRRDEREAQSEPVAQQEQVEQPEISEQPE